MAPQNSAHIVYSKQTDETNLIFCFGVFRTSSIVFECLEPVV